MKVNVIKGPHFEECREKGYELLYHIISAKVKSGEYEKAIRKEQGDLKKDEKS